MWHLCRNAGGRWPGRASCDVCDAHLEALRVPALLEVVQLAKQACRELVHQREQGLQLQGMRRQSPPCRLPS